MSLDTAQPAGAAETEGLPVSKDDAIAAAANVFKTFDPEAPERDEAAERPRGEDGRFVSPNPAPEGDDGGEEIEAEAGAEEAEEAAESQEEGEDGDEAAEEAQRKDPSMPESWPADRAEIWNKLDADAQDFIRQRDAEIKSVTNTRLMEAANVRKGAEALAAEAYTNRERALQATEIAIAMIRPQEPPISMLNVQSPDYDPDGYHLAKAQHDQTLNYVSQLAAQRDQLRAQEQQEAQRQDMERFNAINAATGPAFLRDVPDVADQAKAPAVFRELIEYAVQGGAPQDVFNTPTTAYEWHTLWKAREYDRLQAAKAKVQTDPKPEQKKAGPVVKPGVATPPSARKAAAKQKNLDRLARSGSVEAGAAVWRDILKGT